jgi:SNF2 family DNA or RNA helicase
LQKFLQSLEAGRLLSSGDFRRWLQSEASDDEAEEKESDFEDFLATLPELPADRYDVDSLRAAVKADLEAIGDVLGELEPKRSDVKLDLLKQCLASEELRGRKVVVFSYFKDTTRYIYERLRDDALLGRIAIVHSDVKPAERTERIRRFAPRANGRPELPAEEEIDILISTDVLSEGQNLQDADVIINYDLHWNPVRMVQRVGRLDRLGSPHERIFVYNFFPEEELEELLGLLQRLYEKLDAINRTVGLDASVLGETPNPMNFNILRRLKQEDRAALEELEADSELTVGEFLKQDLLCFLKEVGEKNCKCIPLGVGTARKRLEGPRGFFAAFRNPKTSQHHWLFYEKETDRIVDRRLEAIRPIRSLPAEPAAPLPEGFDPRPWIRKLREHLWNRLRAATLAPTRLPSPQRQIVNWLRAQCPSAERNRLLAYFEAHPLSQPDLKELRRLWRELATLPREQSMAQLNAFMETHPQPLSAPAEPQTSSTPEREDDFECVAWMWVE